MQTFRQLFWIEIDEFLRGPTISAKMVDASERGLTALGAITFDMEARFGSTVLARPGYRRRIGFLVHRVLRGLGFEIAQRGVTLRGGRWSRISRYRRR